MKLTELQKKLKKQPIFSSQELLLLGKESRHAIETRLSEWKKRSEIIQLKKALISDSDIQILKKLKDSITLANTDLQIIASQPFSQHILD